MAVSFGPFPTTGNSRFVSEWGGAVFAGAFGLVTILHLVQGCYYRLWKVATAAIAGGLAAFAGYTLQAAASHQTGDPSRGDDNVQPYLLASAFVLLQIAPLCITLVPYLTLNRLARTRFVPAHDSLPDNVRKPWPSNGRWVAAWPVWVLLVVAVAAQAAAVAFLVYCGLATSTWGIPRALMVAADLVWAGGLAAQGVVVLVLLAAVTHAYATLPPARPGGQQERSEAGTVRPSLPPRRRRQLVWLLGTTYGVLALVVMRVVYRTVVAVMASEGKSTSSTQSASSIQRYALVLDALPTFLALTLLCACHAGWALPATDARHPAPGSGGGGSDRPEADADEDNMDVEAERMDALHDLDSPLERRGVYFGQALPGRGEQARQAGQADAEGGHLSTEQVLLQQRAALQRHYRLRQRQLHRARARTRPGPRHPPPPVVEALARFSLSASLSVSLPRESFVSSGERPPRPPAPGELDEVAGGAPQRLLARLSMDNFILFRFLNTPSRSTSGRRTIPRSARSGAPSRAPSQSQPSQSHGGSHSHADGDDPFAGFDDVAQAGLQNEEEMDNRHDYAHSHANVHDSDSPDEKRGPPEWP